MTLTSFTFSGTIYRMFPVFGFLLNVTNWTLVLIIKIQDNENNTNLKYRFK